jgi:hypothetical protein
MRILTTSFDYNIPAAFTISNSPDRMINVEATGSIYDNKLVNTDIRFHVDEINMADIDNSPAIYQQCKEIAWKRIEEKLSHEMPVDRKSVVEIAEANHPSWFSVLEKAS